MRRYMRRGSSLILCTVFAATLFLSLPGPAKPESVGQLDKNARLALKKLYAKEPKAKELHEKAKAVLVFPAITKGGFIVGGQYGEGVLFRDGKPSGYYNTVAVSYGLQAGIQKYGYALFFMDDKALQYLEKSDGWELGTAPNIVVVDKGISRGLSTTSLQSNLYAFFFNEMGLMAGLGLQGAKITKIKK
ncbi:MAG: lipid-binding SYLF domain-containing protein [Syntrophorhabdaceae bacterium]|nr:lipid-binding SYLF domain-containing protein [Syntrophorhabdaceae bacterium]MDD4197050.1 lipid-binding SYLF domain-containing protein [Syntrophorhabdaceae bacterium]